MVSIPPLSELGLDLLGCHPQLEIVLSAGPLALRVLDRAPVAAPCRAQGPRGYECVAAAGEWSNNGLLKDGVRVAHAPRPIPNALGRKTGDDGALFVFWETAELPLRRAADAIVGEPCRPSSRRTSHRRIDMPSK
jgi:hypothetical protein